MNNNLENNLYYTPTIEEFHVGFEYEHLTGFEKEFQPYIYDLAKACLVIERESISHNGEIVKMFIPAIQACIEEKQCRVKYLDQSDIESLEWIKHATLENVYFKESQEQNLYGTTYLNINNFGKELLIEDDRTGDYLFKGTIKNKSELIKLMKQLSIK